MKKITALSLSAISYLSFTSPAFAEIPIDPCAGGTFSNLCNISNSGVGGIVNAIITILFIVAALLALGFLIFGGIKWVLSGGDKSKVEAARGTIVAALVGLVLVFLSYFIMNLIFNFFGLNNISNLTIPNAGF